MTVLISPTQLNGVSHYVIANYHSRLVSCRFMDAWYEDGARFRSSNNPNIVLTHNQSQMFCFGPSQPKIIGRTRGEFPTCLMVPDWCQVLASVSTTYLLLTTGSWIVTLHWIPLNFLFTINYYIIHLANMQHNSDHNHANVHYIYRSYGGPHTHLLAD